MLFLLIGLFGSGNKVRASYYIFLYTWEKFVLQCKRAKLRENPKALVTKIIKETFLLAWLMTQGMVILLGMSEMQWVIAYLNQVFCDISPVKEQRVEGFSGFRNLNSVRCTLVAGKPVFERKFHFYPYKSFAGIYGKSCRSFTYSSSKQQVNNLAIINKLNPWFITGFIDAEGCFSLGIYPSDKYRMGYRVQAIFKVTLHNKDPKKEKFHFSFFFFDHRAAKIYSVFYSNEVWRGSL